MIALLIESFLLPFFLCSHSLLISHSFLYPVRCTATIAAVYWQSSEEAVEGSQPETQPALESKAVYLGK